MTHDEPTRRRGLFDQPTLHDYIKDHWGDLQEAMGEDDLLRLVVR